MYIMNLINTASVRFIIEINMTIDDIQNITSKLKNDLNYRDEL